MLTIIAFVIGVASADYGPYRATTKSYDLEVPGSSPIRIIEAEPFWDSEKDSEKSTTLQTKTNLNVPNVQVNAEYEASTLKAFLNNFTRRTKLSDYEDDNYDKIELITKPFEEPTNRLASLYLGDEKDPKSWNMLERHRAPYDDKEGWVTLEAIPWSVSKISKWKPKEGEAKPWESQRPHQPSYEYKPNRFSTFPQKPHQSQSFWNKFQPTHDRDEDDCDKEIVTDGLPSDFPEHNRRRGSFAQESPPPHPFRGDVLPPLKNSNVNMTTSHGGLLQVESTFQTVDQAQKAYAKKQKLRVTTRRPVRIKQKSTSAFTMRKNGPDTSAVLAAVGAGMIPATMAMLVPMAMSGRRRRRREAPKIVMRRF